MSNPNGLANISLVLMEMQGCSRIPGEGGNISKKTQGKVKICTALLETLCHVFPKQGKQGIWKRLPNKRNSQRSTFSQKFQCWGENSIFLVQNSHMGAADTAKNKGITSSTFLFGILLAPRPQLQLQKIMVWMGFFNSLRVFIPKCAAAGGIFPGN